MPALTTSWSMDVRALAPHAHNDAVERSAADLLVRWNEPARRYHTTRHLVEVFWALEELEKADEIDDRQCTVARLAAWFHDAIYNSDAEPGSNEADSAVLARDTLQHLGIRDEDLHVINRLIRLTAGHNSDGEAPIDAAFQDADMWILSAPQERFDDYCAQVREEFAHVPDAEYRQGRAALLEPFIHRDTIYRTAHALRAWETAARVNLGRELARLRVGQPQPGE
ncbi:MAG: metal-dependent phosphohydrolase [Actinomycetota bacterium]